MSRAERGSAGSDSSSQRRVSIVTPELPVETLYNNLNDPEERKKINSISAQQAVALLGHRNGKDNNSTEFNLANIVIQNGALTLEQAKDLHLHGARNFLNIAFTDSNKHQTPDRQDTFSLLPDLHTENTDRFGSTKFDNCAFALSNNDVTFFQIETYVQAILVPVTIFKKLKQDELKSIVLGLVQGQQNLEFEKLVLQSTVQQKLSAQILRKFLFTGVEEGSDIASTVSGNTKSDTPHGKKQKNLQQLKHTDIIIRNITVTDELQLSDISVGDNIDDQIKFINNFKFEGCTFLKGIVLPKFITNQCRASDLAQLEKNPNVKTLQKALESALAALTEIKNGNNKKPRAKKTLEQQFSLPTKTRIILRDKSNFSEFVKNGCTRFTGFTFDELDLTENNFPVGTKINISNSIISTLKFDWKTDFSKIDMSGVQFAKDTKIIFVNENNGTVIFSSPVDFIEKINWVRLKAHDNTISVKPDSVKPDIEVMTLLKKISTQKNRLFTVMRNSETLDAFKSLVKTETPELILDLSNFKNWKSQLDDIQLCDNTKITFGEVIFTVNELFEKMSPEYGQKFVAGSSGGFLGTLLLPSNGYLTRAAKMDAWLRHIAEQQTRLFASFRGQRSSDVLRAVVAEKKLMQSPGAPVVAAVVATQQQATPPVTPGRTVSPTDSHATEPANQKPPTAPQSLKGSQDALVVGEESGAAHTASEVETAKKIVEDVILSSITTEDKQTQFFTALELLQTQAPQCIVDKITEAKKNITVYLTKGDKITLLAVYGSYQFLTAVNTEDSTAFVSSTTKIMKKNIDSCFETYDQTTLATAARSYQLLQFVDPETSKQKIDGVCGLLKKHTTFESFLDTAKTKEENKAKRDQLDRELVSAYEFLRSINDSYAAVYTNIIETVLWPALLFYITSGVRIRNEAGDQTHWVNFNALLHLCIAAGIPKAKELAGLSDDRHKPSVTETSRPRLFPSLEEGTTFLEKHTQFVGKIFSGMPLSVFCNKAVVLNSIDATFFISQGDYAFISSKVNAYFEKNASLNAVDKLRLQIEKQVYVAILIRRGEFTVAKNYLDAMQTAWPEMTVNAEIIGSALHAILKAAQDEAGVTEKVGGSACLKLQQFSASELAKHSLLISTKILGDKIQDLKERSEVMSDSILVSKTLMRIMTELTTSPVAKLQYSDIRILQTHSSNNKLRMIKNNTVGTLFESHIPSRKTVLSILFKLTQKPVGEYINETGELRDVLAGVYQKTKANIWLNTAFKPLLDYDGFVWAKNENGTLKEDMNERDIPETSKAKDFFSHEKKIKLENGTEVNVNYYKYLCAVELQKLLAAFNVCEVDQIKNNFDAIIGVLDEITKKIRDGRFSLAINTALAEVIKARNKWIDDVSDTIQSIASTKIEEANRIVSAFYAF